MGSIGVRLGLPTGAGRQVAQHLAGLAVSQRLDLAGAQRSGDADQVGCGRPSGTIVSL